MRVIRLLLTPIDIAGFLAVYAGVALYAITLRLTRGTVRCKTARTPARMLYLAHYSMEYAEREGASYVAFKTDLDGYFDRVATVLFSSTFTGNIDRQSGPRHRIVNVPQQPEGFLKRVGMRRMNLAVSVVRLLKRCAKLVREEKVSLLRAQDPFILGFAAYVTSLGTGVPYAVHVIQNYDISTRRIQRLVFPPFLFGWVERALERAVFANALFTTSSYANYKAYAVCHGSCADRTFSLRTSVDEAHFTSPSLRKNRKAEFCPDDGSLILYVGRLEKVKVAQDLLPCFARIRKSVPAAVLLVVGKGSLKDGLQAEAERLGMGSSVIFAGDVRKEELVDLYYSADAMIFPHAGMTLVEAALSEKPVAAYDHDWSAEFIGHDERGLLAPFRDVDALAGCVVRLLKDKDLARSLGRAAREFAVKNYNAGTIIELERSVFDMFLGTCG